MSSENIGVKDQNDLQTQLTNLKMEKQKMLDEFNVQRAKMKELYLQKEDECNKCVLVIERLTTELNDSKNLIAVAECQRENEIEQQDRKAQEEIASLQHLVHETIEESSYSKSELERLIDENDKLKADNISLRGLLTQQQETASIVPVINQVKKTIARKLGGEPASSTHDMEDSMRKAQEDAEVLRSLVVPLEEEIKALKEKLRTTDEELQKYHQNTTDGTQTSALVGLLNENQTEPIHRLDIESKSIEQNSELNIVKDECDKLRKELERCRDDLSREAALRLVLEQQWQEKREAHRIEVEHLTNAYEKVEYNFTAITKQYSDLKEAIKNELLKLTAERENVNRHLETLQGDNDFLSGRYLATSEELQNQRIDLPNNVTELHELLLKCHESLIEARVGCEFEQRKSMTYYDEAQLLRDQLKSNCNDRYAYEKESVDRIKALEQQLKSQADECTKLENWKESFDKREIDYKKESSELRVQAIELREANDKLNKTNQDLRNKMSVLQQDLVNSEAVQKDFVRLSQSLQMELEKIRAVNTSVRWQDDEDATNCPSCKSTFVVTRRKQHCRHCGTIYCEKCLTKSVPSGSNKKMAKVCDVCHTLLVQDTAPYFSQAPPHSP